jgi:sulfite exporter TauE/SafE
LFIFTNSVRAGVAIGAGILMVIYGINLTGLFPWLKRLWVRGPAFLTRLFFGRPQGRSRSPLVIGLLNGLMIACGPLQAAYLTAAVSGSALRGAVLLFLFGLGTLPVMIGFGFLFNLASMRLTGAFVRYSGVLVVILGLVMLNRGLLLTGTGLDFESLVVSRLRTSTAMEHSVVADGVQTIRMDVVGDGWRPDKFLLKADVPVRWIINGEQINECNKAIQVPRLGLSFDIVPGEQVIEFTPVQEGTIQWSCWMGMIDGCFVVEK